MGIHISVYRYVDSKISGEVDPNDWDFIRHVGDWAFATEVLCDPEISQIVKIDDYDRRYRPSNFDAWRDWDAEQPVNNGRWASLADLLEKDPSLWVEVSY